MSRRDSWISSAKDETEKATVNIGNVKIKKRMANIRGDVSFD